MTSDPALRSRARRTFGTNVIRETRKFALVRERFGVRSVAKLSPYIRKELFA
jgi:hypothetical protein